MRVLDRKVVRDLRRMSAQVLAIALVMACGGATLIMSIGAYRALFETRAEYYEHYRFGDVFSSLVRASRSLETEIAAIDGVASVETRITESVLLDIPDLVEPATAIAISLPVSGDPAVNALYLREGRLPEVATETAVNANFATAHGYTVGSTFSAVMNGAKITLNIVGVVLSPEYVYAVGPGDIMPDDRRFGIVWLPEATLAGLFDLRGAFNSVSLRLLAGANPSGVIDALDHLLEPYGGTRAYGRTDQQSNAFLDSELTQLDAMARIIPPIFLAVAAFLINMILSRLVTLEREQIGLLKAIGYSRAAVVWHYLKLVIAVTAVGAILGAVVGTWAGHRLTILYAEFYTFPFLVFRPAPDIYVLVAAVNLIAAMAGAFGSVRRVFSLPAAVAMQPAPPPIYRRVLPGSAARRRLLTALTVMALRHLWQHPVRTALTTVGVAMAVALVDLALGAFDSIDRTIDTHYFRANRQDVTLAFGTPRPIGASSAVAHLPGVLRAEPYLVSAARISNGQYSRQLAITGKPQRTDLSRVLDRDLNPVVLPETGFAMGDRVAEILHVTVGDIVHVEMLDGQRRSSDVAVTAIIQSYFGLIVYMDIDALARLNGTGSRISGMRVAVDQNEVTGLFQAVKKIPAIAAVALQTVSRQHLDETIRENLTIELSIYYGLAVIIAFGVLYNSARIQLSERARELATLRVLGFGKTEVANVLFIETGTIVVLAQPLGWLAGTAMGMLIMHQLATDIFRVAYTTSTTSYAISSLIVVAAAVFASLFVRRRVNEFDLVHVLKTRE